MSAIKHKIIDGSFPPEEHRISLIQIDVSLSSGNNVSPFSLSDSPEHTEKITAALSSALNDNWANIVVFPEVSIQGKSLIHLMKLSWELLRSRPGEAGAAVICLPLEHLSLNAFEKLLTNLSAYNFFQSGDSSLSSENFSDYLFEKLPPTDQKDAFVNVAVLLVFGQSGSEGPGFYFIQPKRFPYPQENTPHGGKFAHGALNYLLDINGIKIMTVICYDLIAQVKGSGLVLSKLIGECLEVPSGGLDYLLVPQCNDKPLDSNFQRALSQIYCEFQSEGQTLRTLASNVARIIVNGNAKECGQSWFVTSPFGKDLPSLGIWERTLPSVFKEEYTGEIRQEVRSLGNSAQRLRLSAFGEWLLHLTVPDAHQLPVGKGPNISIPRHSGSIWHWKNTKWEEKEQSLFVRDCYYSEKLPGLKVFVELPLWIKENFGGKSTYSPSFDEFVNNIVHLPCKEKEKVLLSLKELRDVWVKGAPAAGKTVFGIGIALDWMKRKNGRSLFFDLKDLDVDSNQFIENAQIDIKWFLMNNRNRLLVVIDNVHTQEEEANKLLRYIHEQRRSGYLIQVLLLGRWRANQVTEKKSLTDFMDLDL